MLSIFFSKYFSIFSPQWLSGYWSMYTMCHNYVVHGVLFLFLATWMKSPHPFKAFPSYLLQTWCTWCVSLPPSPDMVSPAYFVHLPANEGPLSPPASAAADAWLDAILGYFWKEAWIRVPRSSSVYTHTSAGSNWVNEAESRAVRKRGSLLCILASHSFPTAMLPLSCSSVDLWTVFFFICSTATDQGSYHTSQWSVCLQWILLRQAV